MRLVSNNVAKLLVQGAVIDLDTGFEFVDPVVRSDAALDITLAKTSLLAGDHRSGELIRIQSGGIIPRHEPNVSQEVRGEDVLVREDAQRFEAATVLPLACCLLQQSIGHLKQRLLMPERYAQAVAIG